MDARSALHSSDSFLAGYRLCASPGTVDGRPVRPELLPAIVCLAFSVELSLKGLHIAAGAPTRGHKLDALYASLSEQTRDEVRARVGLTSEQFDEQIARAASVFERWRYFHEVDGELEVNDAFLLALAKAAITLLNAQTLA